MLRLNTECKSKQKKEIACKFGRNNKKRMLNGSQCCRRAVSHIRDVIMWPDRGLLQPIIVMVARVSR